MLFGKPAARVGDRAIPANRSHGDRGDTTVSTTAMSDRDDRLDDAWAC